ncbi:MAG TPA: MerR family DNA-binding transcriptional regulator [Aliidongia sp.]|uniref:MerR family transcriptional regulator n=1 Tax=Aliidongia sp. TaxID=1914230 RepID=UPI002DDD2879|nr:MerR family DNA-binding transcriptional regulator [Aliidongia sp.]HEV2673754.1 MerR family DNA-binding transcriptional regulator [Aliidongia sp.]
MSTNERCHIAPDRASMGADSGQAIYSIGDLATDLGVSPRAIRFYEDQGMLAPQRIGGNRVYTQRDLARLKLILRGKRLGFSLSDIRELLDLYYVDRDHLEQMTQTLHKGRVRIAELEQQLGELQMTLHELRELETLLVTTINQRTSGTDKRRTENPEELPTS